MRLIGFVLAGVISVGASFGLNVAAQAEPAISVKSTWELCKNLQPDADVSASLREQSEQELARRSADCAFLERDDKAAAPKVGSNDPEKRYPMLEQNKDLMNRTTPRF